MTWALIAVAALVLFGSLLAMAESSMTRMTRVRALTLREEGRRNADLLVRIEEDPPRYLNSVYLTVMFAQNGSAIVVALVADRLFDDVAVTAASFGFTLLYFVLVEAMSKTYAVLHNDRVALFLAPVVVALSRVFALPVRALIGIANILLPGRGLKTGPFVSEEEIRQMAEAGHESGAIEEGEKELIHSIFEFGDTLVRNVMTPRPDMVVVEVTTPIQEAMDLAISHGFSRIPVYDDEPDNIVGVVYAKDLFKALRRQEHDGKTVRDVMRDPYFVPEAMKVTDLLRHMQQNRIHMAIVADEYGDVAGVVTLEDLLEEIVGEITDEYDVEESRILPVGDGWRVQGKMPIWELNELIDADLPEDEEWQTVGGLVAAALGKIPEPADEVTYRGLTFRVERVQRRRIGSILVRRESDDEAPLERIAR